MSKLKHENIIKIIKSFDDEHNYYLVLELCNKVVILSHNIEFNQFTWQEKKNILVVSQILHSSITESSPLSKTDENYSSRYKNSKYFTGW